MWQTASFGPLILWHQRFHHGSYFVNFVSSNPTVHTLSFCQLITLLTLCSLFVVWTERHYWSSRGLPSHCPFALWKAPTRPWRPTRGCRWHCQESLQWGLLLRRSPRCAPLGTDSGIAQTLCIAAWRSRGANVGKTHQECSRGIKAFGWVTVYLRVQVRWRACSGTHAFEWRDEGVLPLVAQYVGKVPRSSTLRPRIVQRDEGCGFRPRCWSGSIQPWNQTIRTVPSTVNEEAYGGVCRECKSPGDCSGIWFDVSEWQIVVG